MANISLGSTAAACIVAATLVFGADKAGVVHLHHPAEPVRIAAALAAPPPVVDPNADQSKGVEALPAAMSGPSKRVRVTGEVVDSWCQISQIMGEATGTAHHMCAIWCAVGGIPVGILGTDGITYILLKVGSDETTVANPTMVDMQTDQIVVDGDLWQRDGVNYLLVEKVIADQGIVNLSHQQLGILPYGE